MLPSRLQPKEQKLLTMSTVLTALALTFSLAEALTVYNRASKLDTVLVADDDFPGEFGDWQNWSELLAFRNNQFGKDFVFCTIPKNGCSLWKQAFLRALGSDHWNTTNKTLVHNPELSGLDLVGYTAEHEINTSDIGALMGPGSTSLKAAIVRDPITRFLSSYLDRCVDFNEWQRCLTLEPASFEEVISAFEAKGDVIADIHFRNQTEFCGLQFTNYTHYDMIEYYEDFVASSRKVLKASGLWKTVGASGWGVDGTAAFGEVPQEMSNHVSEHSTADRVCEYYTKSLLDRVTALYKPDFAQFGYNSGNWAQKCAEVWKSTDSA